MIDTICILQEVKIFALHTLINIKDHSSSIDFLLDLSVNLAEEVDIRQRGFGAVLHEVVDEEAVRKRDGISGADNVEGLRRACLVLQCADDAVDSTEKSQNR
jgi:hypothetical protein